ncbi:MAG: dihydroxyacetone kinase phosphoryl donor subunit DhaM [Peptoniphilaceae bacterium]|nr:dihydroxyacetone kinase phosphoryl donor subunit DhaM [Peptoniphilaceae bacterium]MDY6018771.1 dihydroxyacetone kinase phosphoryl donor subunit DhaM [Anaerococcus sp.]
MINILILSHSKDLAKGIYDLTSQMAQDVKIDYWGGTEEGGLGSDFEKINEKIISLTKNDDKLVILFDLGSSMMNAQMAIEMLDSDTQKRVILADLPIVEASVELAMQIQIGNSFDQIKAYVEKNKYGKLS